ncbi:MAG: phosphoenolpyruvate carboxylase, partial [Bdellovibrio sp.]
MEQLSKELTSLVDWSVTLLGKVIQSELGPKGFERIENIRRYVKSPKTNHINGLTSLKKDLELLSSQEQFQIAHAFALMLELINTCESAYRTFRLSKENTIVLEGNIPSGKIIHVLTAHPTESRNPDVLYFLRKIQAVLIQRLQQAHDSQTTELTELLTMSWHIPMSKQRKPSVMDEAEYIYSLALQKEIIDVYIQNERAHQPFHIRTWVGGDKDGNPIVDEKTMLGSLNQSRKYLLKWLEEVFESYIEQLEPLSRSSISKKADIKNLLLQSKKIKISFTSAKDVTANDSQRVSRLSKSLNHISLMHAQLFENESETLVKIKTFFNIFPGLVVPLELREESALVHEALKKPVKSMNISRMLQTLKKICHDESPRNYVRGFILSQCESAADIMAGIELVQRFCEPRLPVVPLFESAHSLSNSTVIVEDFLKLKKNFEIAKKYWHSQLEIMLGYSDSAKENGALPSRYLIQSSIVNLENKIKEHGLTPVFFHGSGGSIERGGGSVQEQTDWWPSSALNTVKTTVQGEMVYRNYSSPLILQRQLNLLIQIRAHRKQKAIPHDSKQSQRLLIRLSEFIQNNYQEILKDPEFLELIEKATPYSYLKDLKMGSRPSKRQGPVTLTKLRAIPWVLCWTQTRILFPTWWGIGTFWSELNKEDKQKYQDVFQKSAMFRTYIKALGFTLKKIEIDVFCLYLRSSKLKPTTIELYENLFRQEYKKA